MISVELSFEMNLRFWVIIIAKKMLVLMVFVCDASLRADAGHRADDRVIIVRTRLRPG